MWAAGAVGPGMDRACGGLSGRGYWGRAGIDGRVRVVRSLGELVTSLHWLSWSGPCCCKVSANSGYVVGSFSAYRGGSEKASFGGVFFVGRWPGGWDGGGGVVRVGRRAGDLLLHIQRAAASFGRSSHTVCRSCRGLERLAHRFDHVFTCPRNIHIALCASFVRGDGGCYGGRGRGPACGQR